MGGLVAFEMARQLDAAGEPVELVALLDTRAPGTQEGDPEAEPERLARRFARDLEALTGEPVTSPPGDLPADLQRLFAIFKDNLRAMYSYAPRAYPGPVTLFLAGEGHGVEGAALAWRTFAGGGVEAHRVPGDHYSLLRRPHVELLAERLRACLDGCPGKE
jgi:thioesterase domain-containing protein